MVLPLNAAPALSILTTQLFVLFGTGCVANQSGLPAAVGKPSISNKSFTASPRPLSGLATLRLRASVEPSVTPWLAPVFREDVSSSPLLLPLKIASKFLIACVNFASQGLSTKGELTARYLLVIVSLLVFLS